MGVIKNSDVFGPDLFTKEAKDAKTLNDALNIVEQSLKDIAKLSVKAFKGVNPKTADDIKKVNKAVKESKKAVSDLEKFEKQRLATMDKLKVANSDRVQGLVELQLQLKKQNAINKETAALAQKNIGTLDRLRLQNKKLRRELDGLNLTTEKGRKRQKELIDQINKNTKFIKKNTDEVRKNAQNVGNYADSIKEAAGASGLFGGVLGKLAAIQGTVNALTKKAVVAEGADVVAKEAQAAATAQLTVAQRAGNLATAAGTKALKFLKIAFASTGIGFLVVALISLFAVFTRNQDRVDQLSDGMARLSAFIDVLIDRMSLIGEGLILIFGGIGEEVDKIKIKIQIFFLELAQFKVFGQSVTDNTAEIAKLNKELDSLVGVSAGIDLLAKAFSGLGKELKEDNIQAGILRKLTREAAREAKLFEAQQATGLRRAKEQEIISRNKLNSDAVRLEALRKSNEILLKLSNDQLAIQDKLLASSLDALTADSKGLKLEGARLEFVNKIKDGQISAAEAVKLAADFTLSSAAGEEALFAIIERIKEQENARTTLAQTRATLVKKESALLVSIANKKSTELARESIALKELAKNQELSIEERIRLLDKAAIAEIGSFEVRAEANIINAKEAANARIKIEAKLQADITKLQAGTLDAAGIAAEKKRLADIQKIKQGFIDTDIKEGERELEAEIRRQNKLTEVTEADVRKRIAIVNEISEDSKEKVQKQAEFELENADLTAEERTLIAQKLQADLAELEDQRVNANKDANDEIIENEKKASKERLGEAQKLANEVFSMTKAELAKKDKETLKSLDNEIKGQENLIKTLRQNAVEGSEKALAFEEVQLEKQRLARQREQERQQRRNEAIALAQTFLNQVAEQSKDNPDTAIAEAFKNTFLARAIARGLVGFIDGTELVERDMGGSKFSNGQDGYLARFDGKERILNPSQNMALPKGMSNDQLVEAAQQYDAGNTWAFMPKLQAMDTVNNIDLSEVVASNNRVVKAIENNRVQISNDYHGLHEWIETRIVGSQKEVIKHMLKRK